MRTWCMFGYKVNISAYACYIATTKVDNFSRVAVCNPRHAWVLVGRQHEIQWRTARLSRLQMPMILANGDT